MIELIKTYNTTSGEAKFIFSYNENISNIKDFDIIGLSGLSKGYDNENNIDIAVFPDNIEIKIDTFDGNNYKAFRELYENYKSGFPVNALDYFFVTIYLNGAEKFSGYIYELESDANEYEIKIKFVDGINYFKAFTILDPNILDRLFYRGIISRAESDDGSAYAYGFETIQVINDPNYTGYYVGHIENGDKDTRFLFLIKELFKLFSDNLQIEFQNRFSFKDILEGAPEVTIDAVDVRRIHSNFIGRYFVINKLTSPVEIQIVKHPNPNLRFDYNNPENFSVVYEDETYKVFQHTWSGNTQNGNTVLKWEKGVDEKNISDLLKLIAKNLFSYYGFKSSKRVFFRHRRYNSEVARTLTKNEITTMRRSLTVSKIQGVKIEDYYAGTYALRGKNYAINNVPQINYKIPFNAFRTANAPFFEYRLKYTSGGEDYRVIYFKDLENIKKEDGEPYENLPMETIAEAENKAHGTFRDKYDIVLIGVNYNFDETVAVDYTEDDQQYTGNFRIITMNEDWNEDETTLTVTEVHDAEL